MFPDLGQPYSPTWEGGPPHMAIGDVPLWRRYQAKHALDWIQVYYDSALGEPATPPEGQTPAQIDMWQRITRLRADAIILTRDGWIIAEVRPHAGPAALGTLYTYLITFEADPPTKDPVTALLITDQVTPDLRLAADKLGIPIEIV
jgi:hypothetical protein